MKSRPNPFLRSAALAASIVLCLGQAARAETYFWDNNSTTAGFGTAGSTWGTEAFWTTDSSGAFGVAGISGPLITDDLNFGTTSLALAAGTVNITGTVNAQSITFGSASGAIVLSGGTEINLGGTGRITVNNTSNTISTVIDGTAGLTKLGTGTLILNGTTANSFTGGLTINRGTLSLDFTNFGSVTSAFNNLVASSNALTLGGGTLSITGKSVASATTSQSFASTTLNSGASTIALTNGGSSATSTTIELNTITRNTGATLNFSNIPTTTGIIAKSTGTAAGLMGGWVTVGTGVVGAATPMTYAKVDSSSRIVAAKSDTVANSGDLITGVPVANWTSGGASGVAGSSFQNSGGGSLGRATSINLFRAINAGAQVIDFGGTLNWNFTVNGIMNVGSSLLTLQRGAAANNLIIGANRDLVVTGPTAVTISAPIVDSSGGASALTYSGTSTLTLSGANTYSGITTINSGTLAITSDGANGATSSQLGAVPSSATADKLVLSGGTLSIVPVADITLASNRGILLNAGGGTITNTATGTARSATINAIIAGSGGLTLNTAGIAGNNINIGGLNTFTGGATLSGTGTVVATNNQAFGIGGTLTLNGAGLRGTTGGTTTIANPVSIAANTTFVAAATTSSTSSEKSLVFSGNAVISGATRTLTGNMGTNIAGIFTEFSGNISESAAGLGLTKAGNGTIVLSGTNTYTGVTTVSAGRLALTKNTALYSNNTGSWTDANIIVNSGATLALNVGTSGTNFTSSNIDTLAALGTATTGFRSGSFLGLDTSSGDFTYASNLVNPNAGANTLGVIKLGSNKLTLSGVANTYTGITMIGGGTLVAGSTSAFGAAANNVYFMTTPAAGFSGNQLAGGNLELATDSSVNAYNLNGTSSFSSTLTLNRATAGAGITQNLGTWAAGNNVLNVTKGANVTSGTATVSFTGMSLGAGSSGSSTLTPTDTNISITGAVNSTSNHAKNLVLDGNIAGNSISGDITNGTNVLSLTKSGASTWTLSGINSYTGTTAVNAGTLVLSGTNTGAGATNVVGGTLQAGAASAFNPNSAVTMTDAAAALLDLNGNNNSIGSLAGGGGTGGNVTLGAGTLTTGGNNASTTYAGGITGNGGLTKTGSGAFTLNSAQGYLGATAVNAGSLIVNSTLASSGVTVANTGTLGGTGTISNLVTINSGGTLSAATATTAGTLTLGSLTLDSGSNLAYEFGGTNDLIAVTGANGLTIDGGALSLYSTGGVSPLTANGTYTLFSYLTGFGGSLSNLSVANSQAGKTYALNDTGSLIQLTLGTATSADWSGTFGDGLWTSDGVGGNWSGGSAPNALGAVANFGNIPASPTAVTLDAGKTVGSIIFDNANSYTINAGDTITLDNGIASGAIGVTSGNHVINAAIALNGPANITPATGTQLTLGGIISGAKAVTFSGAGTTILTASNSYSGATTISAGTLRIGNGTDAGSISSSSSITNNAALVYNVGSGSRSHSNVISGSGTLTQDSTGGTLTLSGSNTYTGATTITTGVLNIQNNTALGTAAGATSVTAGAALQVQGGLTAVAENLTLNGTGIANDGALRSISGANFLSGTVALGSTGVRINSDTAATALTLSNAAGITGTGYNLTVGGAGDTVISGGVKTGASATLTKDGDGTLTLAGASTYTGATTITSGKLLLQSGAGYATSGFAIASNAVLELNTGATPVSYSTTTFSGAGTLRKTGTVTAFWSGAVATFALDSGSLIDVQEGILTGGSNANEVWTTNKSDLNVASGAVFETVEANVRVDALSGSGVIATGYNGSGYSALTIGVAGDDGIESNTFTGTLASGHGTGNITKIGSGTQIFNGSGGTYTGNLTLTDGVFSIDTIANGGLSTTLTTTAASNTATVGDATGLQVGMAVWSNNNGQRAIVPYGTTITAISGNTLTLSNNAVVNSTAVTGAAFGFGSGLGIGTNAAARLVFNGGTLQYTGATASTDRNFTINAGKTATIDISNAATNLTISGASTATTGALAKIGSGALTLSGSNTYTGGTAVKDGSLILAGGNDRLVTTGSVSLGDVATSGKLVLGDTTAASNQTLAGLTATDLGGSVVGANATTNSVLTLNIASGTNTFGGFLGGGGTNENKIALTKSGNGTLELTNASIFTGGTTLSSGKLLLSNASAAGSAAIAVSGASTTLEISSATLIANNVTVSNNTASIIRKVGAAGNYNVGTSGALTSNFIGTSYPDTTAKILAGTNSSGSDATLTMSFNDASAATNDTLRRSDVFSVSGTTGTDAYVLQLTAAGLASDSVLGSSNGGIWDLAISGNTGNNALLSQQNYVGSFTAFQIAFGSVLSDYIGAYGYDSGGTSVWAVLNYGSVSGAGFAAIPEPTSALVGLLIGAGLLRRRRVA